jgi:anti-anti-sigma regulatory factor/anti-sigma regulatory factor (Ser/Thr protein kinase)
MAAGGRLAVAVDRHADTTVLRLSGPLTAHTARTVRAQMDRCLAEYPAGLIVDLAGVTVATALSFAVFLASRREAQRWPGIPLLLCRPSPAVVGALTGRQPLIYATLEQAVAALDAPARARPIVHADLLASAGACPQARDIVRQTCHDWDLAELGEIAELIVAELVANAVRHARPPLRLLVALLANHLHIAIRDGSVNPPRPTTGGMPPDSVDGGRGLYLVTAFATRWGSSPAVGGKVVWAALHTGRPRK